MSILHDVCTVALTIPASRDDVGKGMATCSDACPVHVVLVKRDGDSLWLSSLLNVLREIDSGAEDGRGGEEECGCEDFVVEQHCDRCECSHSSPSPYTKGECPETVKAPLHEHVLELLPRTSPAGLPGASRNQGEYWHSIVRCSMRSLTSESPARLRRKKEVTSYFVDSMRMRSVLSRSETPRSEAKLLTDTDQWDFRGQDAGRLSAWAPGIASRDTSLEA